MTTYDQYQAGATVGGSLNATLGSKWLSQAKVEISASLTANGTWSTENVSTVTVGFVDSVAKKACAEGCA